ncbi:Exocyst complex component EXO70B1 like [Actinidia chinensis var. chinensis]|uniref:Exocyst subunit Exo70 family protein n=1 Tax=Actinidia chinensis var. chinensis TaxID=1590841 RepID=A0A2R6P8Z2_ACTCC|nr:Exocyst complex component EXO70B1 like [Actinidia chinensis var. chinensis]
METEKDKHLPEKSPSFASREDQDHDNQHHVPDPNMNPEQDHHQNNDDNNTENPESSTEAEPKSENIEAENKEEEATERNVEESPPPPDFSEVCVEIDQFISDLSSAKCQESDPPDVPKVVEQFAFLMEAKIANYDSTESPMKWNQLSDGDSSSFLEAVDQVSKLTISLTAFSSESKYNSSINRIGCILQRAMSYLEDEFKSLLESLKIPDSPSSHSNQTDDQSASQESNATGENNIFLGYSEEVVSNLNRLAKAMRIGGYETECYQVYIVVRRSVFEETLHELGFQKFSIDEIQKMQWESLEREIDSWKQTFKQFATVYFARERKLSEAVFTDHGSLTDGLFSSLTGGIMIQLLNFAQAVAMTKRSSEKLFKVLDIYETLRDVVPSMDDLFPEEIGNEIKSEASLTRSQLGESTVFIFCELENSIKADTGKMTVPGGAVHPLTRYTMNYLKYACEYKDTLEQIFREHQKIERADSGTGSDYDYNSHCGQNHNNHKVQQSPFALQINKVMDLLDTGLETKSKLYKDTSLSSLFMMNNGRYILQKIKGATEINDLMGDTWSRKRSSDLRQYHKNYQRETWGKLLSCLNHEGLSLNGKVVKPVLKEKFKSFNVMFDEIHRTQSTWVVSDKQLQSELRVSISSVVVPAYRSFLARFSQTFTPGRQTEKYVKYQPEDIETYIEELFDGNATAMGRRRP